MNLASRMSRLGTETAFEVLARARALEAKGYQVVHLEIGEPDFDTPKNVVDAGVRALQEGQTHYGPGAGMPVLREAIAAEVARTRKTRVSADQVVVTPGAKPILFFSLLALLEEGEEAIFPDPGFPIYESMIRFLGARPVPITLHEEAGFALDVEELGKKLSPKTRLLVLNSPGNPCGNVLSRADVDAIGELLRRHPRVWCLTDEIYGRILYEGELHSPFSFEDLRQRLILLDGFSKAYAMTGWRLGYGVMPAEFANAVTRLQINSTSCTASFTQIAGVEALVGPQDSVSRMVEEFRRRRDVIVEGLNRITGFRCTTPRGAFYVFPNITGTGKKSKEVERLLLEEAGVAALAGTAFGAAGEGFVRFSYANSVENIRTALSKMSALFA